LEKTLNKFFFNILYIEDDTLTRQITTKVLQKFSSNIIQAKDGLDAFKKFKENDINLIITDLLMPNINGNDFIKMIRDIDMEIPIIIISAHLNSSILEESINYGIQGYIQKPINHKSLEKQIGQIKNQLQAKHLSREYESIAKTSAIISKINQDGIITYVNERYCQISGFTKEELLGQSHSLIKSKKDSPQFFNSVWNKIAHHKEVWSGVLKHKNKDGSIYYLKTTIQPILNFEGEIEQFITLSLPVTEIVNHEKQLNDFLKQKKKAILLLIKIEEFKYLKHSFTNKITKRLQKLFAKELLKHMPKECHFSQIYLLDNGEFVFVKEDNEFIDKEYLVQTLNRFQEKVNSQKIKIGIVDYTLSIVSALAYGENAFENAKIGLKKILSNKEEFIVAENFLEEETKKSTKKLNQFIMLKEAIESYNIVSHFQAIIDNKTKEVVKYESLVRLIDNRNNIISPYHFLELSKEGKYYHTITSIVLKNSFRALFHVSTGISINLSALDIEDKKIRTEFFNLLKKYRTEAHRITIELVEDERMKSEEEIQEFVSEVREYGVKIALDDFGKGFSNFSRIQAYHPDYIKIDGSLIRNIETDSFSKDLIETIVFFAKKQKIKTVAEFVENERIYNILTELGVDYSQGHYFAKAAPLEEAMATSFL